ncbi:MAG: amidohydrolase family protein, partial [Gammaproteobacteria bacterium]|nr:amidohydrolase family protein [Gammaproteobacteria bacterium]
LVCLAEHVYRGIFDIETIVRKTAHAPARLFGVKERGFIREGYHADLTVLDPSTVSDPKEIHSKCGWSPFEGIDLHARVRATWVNGHLRYDNGRILDGPMGAALEFARS